MSGFHPKAEVAKRGLELPLIAKLGHSNPMHSVPFDCAIRLAHRASLDCHQQRIRVRGYSRGGGRCGTQARRHHVGGCGRLFAPEGETTSATSPSISAKIVVSIFIDAELGTHDLALTPAA